MGGLITVVMTTCAKEGEVGDLRADYAMRAISSLMNLRYDGPMRLHFADDGSRPGHRHQLLHWGHGIGDWSDVTVTDSEGKGIGVSLNLALDFLDSDLIFYMPDDWVLTRELDLTIPAKILEDESIGMVRTGMIHPDIYARTVYGGPELQYYWIIDKKASGYSFTFRTFLAHRRFWEAYGPFPGGHDIYNGERIYNQHVREADGPAIAYAGNVGLNWPWKHIGEVAVSGQAIG